MASYDLAEKENYTVYELDGVTYLPHYSDSFHYVGPGYGHWNITTYYATTLLAAGAVPKQAHLWKRVGRDTTEKKMRAYERTKG
jgi:hypothetical protein